MRRLISAIREWVELRKRVREEFEFHFERATTDFELLGLGLRVARRHASRRMGGSRFLREARREIGADMRGLLHLLAVHGVPASPLFQPVVLSLFALVVLSVSPSAKATIESLLGTPLGAADRESVFISRQAQNLSFRGVTQGDVKAIRSMPDFTVVEPYQGVHIRARLRRGVEPSRIEGDLSVLTGSELRVMRLFDRSPIIMAPARAAWCVVLMFGLWQVRERLRAIGTAAYVVLTGAAHALVSLVLWSVAVQLWLSVPWQTDGRAALAFVGLLMTHSGSAILQARHWIRDAAGRCPICFEKLRLAETTGRDYNTVIDQATTQSLCIYGHGGFREDRWTRSFRRNESYWDGLTRA